MTAAQYSEAFGEACSVRFEPTNLPLVRAVHDAHILHLKRVEVNVEELKKERPSKQKEAALRLYKHQQDMSHMKTPSSVQEYYRTALLQTPESVSMFMSTSLALESRLSYLEMQKDVLLATLTKCEPVPSRAPLRIVKLLFEGTSTQHELKCLIKTWVSQNLVKFVGMSEEQFLQEICSYPWRTSGTPSEKVTLIFSISLLILFPCQEVFYFYLILSAFFFIKGNSFAFIHGQGSQSVEEVCQRIF